MHRRRLVPRQLLDTLPEAPPHYGAVVLRIQNVREREFSVEMMQETGWECEC